MNSDPQFQFSPETNNDWGDCAFEYSRLASKIGFYREIAEKLVDLVDPDAQEIMDFGCGDGRLVRKLLERRRMLRGTVYLVDKYKQMLDLTDDIVVEGTEFVRLCDDERLQQFPPHREEQIDCIACNSSFHLCREPLLFIRRCHDLLRLGGTLVANIPDQAYDFGDGWFSSFREEANKIWYDASRKIPPGFSDKCLRTLANDNGFDIVFDEITCPLPWQDFLRFYSIPFMGARRMPNKTQQERLAFLQAAMPPFVEIPYRWAFFVMRKHGSPGGSQ